jgi:hypothetical protein
MQKNIGLESSSVRDCEANKKLFELGDPLPVSSSGILKAPHKKCIEVYRR